jgi:hypothetical protein
VTARISPNGRRTDISRHRILALVLVTFLGYACGPSGEGVESEITRLVDSGAEAVKSGDARSLATRISTEYEDDQGRDRRAMIFMLRALLARYPDVFVLVRDLRVRPLSGELATADMILLLAGRDSARPLPAGLDADRLRLRLALRRYGQEWKVTRAEWGKAGIAGVADPN